MALGMGQQVGRMWLKSWGRGKNGAVRTGGEGDLWSWKVGGERGMWLWEPPSALVLELSLSLQPGKGGLAGQGEFQSYFIPSKMAASPQNSPLSQLPLPHRQAHTPAGPKEVTDQEHANQWGPCSLHAAAGSTA